MDPLGLYLSLITIAIASCILLALRAYNSIAYLPKLEPGQAPLPEGSLGLPLLGQTLELFRDFKRCPDNFWRKRIARHGKAGGLFKSHLFGSPTIITTTPETIRAIALDGENFAPGWPKSTMRLAGGQSFLFLMGEDYKRLRRLASLAVSTPHTLNKVVTSVEKLTLEALHRWSHMGQFLLINELLGLTFDIIAGLLMGKLPNEDNKEFCKEFHDLNAGIRSLPFNIPGFAFHRALKARKKIVKRIHGYIDNRIASPNVMHGDVLESLMNMIDDEGKRLSLEEIVDSLVAFLLAGHESSAHTAMWIMIFLSKHPDKLQKLMDEQTRIATKKSKYGEGLTVSDYKGMSYLYSVIDETLRIINISPFTFRKSLNTIEINGYTIPKNWTIALWFRANHLNEDIFSNPYSFNPERWQDIKLKAGMYTPFGLGARSCIGMELAKLELAVLVHNLVLKYRWELINPNFDISYLPRARPNDNCPILIYPK